MKRKKLTILIVSILIAVFACYGVLLTLPQPVAQAAENETAYLFMEDPNHPLQDIYTVVSNKPIGIYIHPFDFYDDIVLVYIDSFRHEKHILTGEITLFPVINGIKYDVYFYIKSLQTLSSSLATIIYDIETPYISAETNRGSVENNATVIGEQITVKAHDNFTNLNLFVSKDNDSPQECNTATYDISEDGTYTFYAVDQAGNYSDNFIVTYYLQEPIKKPDESITPDDAIPTDPATPEKPIMDSENTTSRNIGIIVLVVIAAIVIVGTTTVIIYRKVKAKSTLDDCD